MANTYRILLSKKVSKERLLREFEEVIKEHFEDNIKLMGVEKALEFSSPRGSFKTAYMYLDSNLKHLEWEEINTLNFNYWLKAFLAHAVAEKLQCHVSDGSGENMQPYFHKTFQTYGMYVNELRKIYPESMIQDYIKISPPEFK